jgi:hypothetical protein
MHALRRTAMATAALALAGSAAAVTVAGPASAGTGNNAAVQYCQSIASLPGINMGACVSYAESHAHNTAAWDVQECQTQLVPAGTFANMGSCVSFLNNFKGT